MKNIQMIFIKVVIIALLSFSFLGLFAQDPPPPPPNGGKPGGGVTPVGGGAPIGSGVFILLALGTAYGGKKVFDNRVKN